MNQPVLLAVIAIALLPMLGACVGNPPKGLEPAEAAGPAASAVQSDPKAFVGQSVRWGGEILAVRNLKDVSEVEVYGRPLFNNAEPQPDGGDGVRFLARIGGFVDPAEYAAGKRLTVRGALGAAERRPVGDYPYLYPVIKVDVHHLWPVYKEPVEPVWVRDPFYHDPWGPWGPWGPFGRWPYYY